MVLMPKKPASGESDLGSGTLVVYQHNDATLLGVILEFKSSRYLTLNERDREVELAPTRLHRLPGKLPSDHSDRSSQLEYLATLKKRAEKLAQSYDLGELWTFVVDEGAEFTVERLCDLYFGSNELDSHLGLYLALLADRIYFRRKKELFCPRKAEIVEELQKAEEARRQREELYGELARFLDRRSSEPELPIPDTLAAPLSLLEDLAVDAAVDEGRAKEAKYALDQVCIELGLPREGPRGDRANAILRRANHFTDRTNPALIRHRPPTSWHPEAIEQAELIGSKPVQFVTERARGERVDYRDLEMFTIDDVTTRDMDDGLSLTETADGFEVGVHITDVAALIPHDSRLDLEARSRATSIYCPDITLHMFPDELAEKALSLNPEQDRPAISCFMRFSKEHELLDYKIEATLVRSSRRYSYDEVDQLLEQGEPTLLHLYEIATAQEAKRIDQGAVKVNKRDVQLAVDEDGVVTFVDIDEQTPARSTVGELMVTANSCTATWLHQHQVPVFFRGQPASDEELDDTQVELPPGPALDYVQRGRLKKSTVTTSPERHASLALDAYIQITSPIRRYMDLCNQRQLLSFLETKKPHYTEEQLTELYREIEPALARAGGLTRESKRFWLLSYLRQRKDRTISGTVVRTDLRHPLAELDEIYIIVPVRTKKMPERGVRITAKIGKVDALNDYLRLEEIKP